MRQRVLGATGLRVSAIGFGCWGIGGSRGSVPAYGDTDDAASSAALERALELGINFFDTADLYGGGHSEELLGRTFEGRRERVILATKAGMVDASGQVGLSPDSLRRSLAASLKRLRTDYVDLFQVHSPPLSELRGCTEVIDSLHDRFG